MQLLKKLFITAIALSVAGFAYAQDSDWASDDWSTGSDDFSSSEQTEDPLSIGGSIELNARAYIEASDSTYNSTTGKLDYADRPDFGKNKTEAIPIAKLNFDYRGPNTDLFLKLKFDKTSLGQRGNYYWDILDEFTARAYVGNAQLEAGKMRVVWGKGDKIHVLDNFNANDYLDYIIPDYIDRRISEPMLRFVYSTNSNIKVEAVYTPMMTPDRLADSGVWQPKASKKLTNTVSSLMAQKIRADLQADNGAALIKDSAFKASDLYADTNQLKYGQAGLRTTFSIGGCDLGLSYYYGHLKQPSANTSAVVNATAAATMSQKVAGTPYAGLSTIFNRYTAANPSLDYDQVQTFGFEAAGILFGRFNSRMEFAYNLTDDIAGDDPWVHNNSIAWVAGFDIDLPIHNINFNIQNQGKYILNNDKIGDAKFSPLSGTAFNSLSSTFSYSYKQYDVDYDANDCYTNNKIIVAITDTWNHEKIKLDLKGIWGIERSDLIVLPTLTFIVKDDWNLNLSGMYIWCLDENSEFDGWQRNSFGQIGVKYQF